MGLDMYLLKVNKPEFLKPGKMYMKNKILSEHKELELADMSIKLLDTIKNNSLPISVKYFTFSARKVGDYFGCYDADKVELSYYCKNTFYIHLYDKTGKRVFNGELKVSNMYSEKEMSKFADFSIKAVYAYCIEEIAYQRNGLNDYGRKLLPENCEYCDDYDRIKSMVLHGDLKHEFLDLWKGGKTMFLPWW